MVVGQEESSKEGAGEVGRHEDEDEEEEEKPEGSQR